MSASSVHPIGSLELESLEMTPEQATIASASSSSSSTRPAKDNAAIASRSSASTLANVNIFDEDEQSIFHPGHMLDLQFKPKLIVAVLPLLLLTMACGFFDSLAVSLVPVGVTLLVMLGISWYASADWRAWLYAFFPCGGRCIVDKSSFNADRLLHVFMDFRRGATHERLVQYDENLPTFPLLQPGPFETLEIFLALFVHAGLFALSRMLQPCALDSSGVLFPLCWVSTGLIGITALAIGLAGAWTPAPRSAMGVHSYLEQWSRRAPAAARLRQLILQVSQHNVKYHELRSSRLLILLLLSVLFSLIFVAMWIWSTVVETPTAWQLARHHAATWVSVFIFLWICSVATLESMRCLSVLDFDRLTSECLWRLKALTLMLREQRLLRVIHTLPIDADLEEVLEVLSGRMDDAILAVASRIYLEPNTSLLSIQETTATTATTSFSSLESVVSAPPPPPPRQSMEMRRENRSPLPISPHAHVHVQTAGAFSTSDADRAQAWLHALRSWREARMVIIRLDTNFVFTAGSPLIALLLVEAAALMIVLVYQIFASRRLWSLVNFTVVYVGIWNIGMVFFMASSMLRVFNEYNAQMDLLRGVYHMCSSQLYLCMACRMLARRCSSS